MSKGIPKKGDRAAWDVANYGTVHASDIEDETFTYHNDPENPPGIGDMLKSVYDTDNSGTVDAAESVPWSGVSGTLLTYPPDSHTHVEVDITDLNHDAVSIQGATVSVPDAGDDGKALVYNHSGTAFIYSELSAGGGGTIIWYDEGALAGTASIINVTGDGGTISVDGGTATINISGAGGGGGSIIIYDEGILAGTVSIFNFTGTGVEATVSGGTAAIEVSGGTAGGGATDILQVQVFS